MAYRMVEVTARIRVGVMSNGDLDVEVYDRPWRERDAQMQAIVIPSGEASDLAQHLIRVA